MAVPAGWRDRLQRVQPRTVIDGLWVLVLLAGTVFLPYDDPATGSPVGRGERPVDALHIGLVLLAVVPLFWRRRAPVLVTALVAAAFVGQRVFGYGATVADLGLILAVYSVAQHGSRWSWVAVDLAGLVALVIAVALPLDDFGTADAVLLGVLALALPTFVALLNRALRRTTRAPEPSR